MRRCLADLYFVFKFYHKNFRPPTIVQKFLKAGAAAECGASRDKIIQSPPHQHLMIAKCIFMCELEEDRERRSPVQYICIRKRSIDYNFIIAGLSFTALLTPGDGCNESREAQPEVRHSRPTPIHNIYHHAAFLVHRALIQNSHSE
jgi:hypothetical protein